MLRDHGVVDIVLLGRGFLRQLMGRSCYHKLEALFRGRQLGDVVLGVGTADVLLHGAVALLLWTHAWLLRCLADDVWMTGYEMMSRWKINHSKQKQHWTIARKAAESKECKRSSDSKWYNETKRDSRRGISCGNGCHPGYAEGRRPRC